MSRGELSLRCFGASLQLRKANNSNSLDVGKLGRRNSNPTHINLPGRMVPVVGGDS